MSSADSERYDIYFSGECLEGHAVDAVREAVGKLFKAEGPTLDRLFSGQRQRIKRDCDKTTALRYQKAMAAAGARAIVTASDSPAPAVPSATEASASAPAEPGSDTAAELSLAPAGSDVLRPEERIVITPPNVDLQHLSVAEAGEDLGPAEKDVAASVEAPAFDVAAPGTDLAPESETPTVSAPDTSAIDLAPADYDLSDCQPAPPPAPELDLGKLSIADAGGELLRDEERSRSDAVAPDTSHLQLDQPEDT